ncbi:bacteriocin [Chryseobacterium soli]|uniref:bacteriocin-like protein n=1 Tax=Chryseobacterium soli TaxID=445961 RepID=UPI000A8BBAD7|nr:bacteriocin [Chryseobacterium soli]MDV7696610.1 bacteriocin [Chryseobacterium soli]
MKNLKKLDNNELKTISGGGLLDPVCQLICTLADSGLLNLTQVQMLLCPDLDCSKM